MWVKVVDSALPGSVCLLEQRSPTARSAAKETKGERGWGGKKERDKEKVKEGGKLKREKPPRDRGGKSETQAEAGLQDEDSTERRPADACEKTRGTRRVSERRKLKVDRVGDPVTHTHERFTYMSKAETRACEFQLLASLNNNNCQQLTLFSCVSPNFPVKTTILFHKKKKKKLMSYLL